MHWNHRVLQLEGECLGIVEAYYDDPTDKLPHSATESSVAVIGDNLEGLKWTLDRMLEALARPILKWEGNDLVEAGVAKLVDALDLESSP